MYYRRNGLSLGFIDASVFLNHLRDPLPTFGKELADGGQESGIAQTEGVEFVPQAVPRWISAADASNREHRDIRKGVALSHQRLQFLHQLLTKACACLIEDGEQEVVFRGEVVMEQSRRDASKMGNFLDRCGFNALLREEGKACGYQPRSIVSLVRPSSLLFYCCLVAHTNMIPGEETFVKRESRLTMSELGRRVGMSSPAVTERVHRLEEAGVIRGYRLEVDFPSLCFVICGYVDAFIFLIYLLKQPLKCGTQLLQFFLAKKSLIFGFNLPLDLVGIAQKLPSHAGKEDQGGAPIQWVNSGFDISPLFE